MSRNTCFLAVLVFLAPLLAGAEFSPPAKALSSVVMLYSSANGSCGSGAILGNGLILTSSHLLASLCPSRHCSSVLIRSSESLNSHATKTLSEGKDISISGDFPALDAALIKVNGLDLDGAFDLSRNAAPTGTAYVLGFPDCARLRLTSGAITESDVLRLRTSATIHHGSSGGPVFNASLELIGIVDEASSPAGALASKLTGGGFSARAVRADVLNWVSTLSTRESLQRQTQTVNSYYSSQISALTGVARLFGSLDFISTAQGIKSSAADLELPPAELEALYGFGEYPSWIFRLKSRQPTELAFELEKLALSAQIEQKGPFSKIFLGLDLQAAVAHLKSLGYSDEQTAELKRIIVRAADLNYPGAEMYMIKWGLAMACMALSAIPIAFLFGWYVRSRIRRH